MAYIPKPCRGCGRAKEEVGRGICYCAACASERKSKYPVPRKDAGRIARMAKMYRAGQTLARIGAQFGVTRERVRQLIKSEGLTGKHGGLAVSSRPAKALRAARRIIRLDRRAMRVYGCTHAEFVVLNEGLRRKDPGSLANAYTQQRNTAGIRGIGWEMTFPEWVGVWRKSGHLAERGRTGDGYVMARYADSGPYSVANVYITTLRVNSRDFQAHRLGRAPSYANP
jgi:hypothetical protein